MAAHWDGLAWTKASLPTPTASNGQLHGVDALGTNDVWAVGQAGNHAYALHFDGAVWSVVPGADPDNTKASDLYTVEALAPNDVWAGGHVGSRALMEHWDGAAWTRYTLPSDELSSAIFDIGSIAASDIWAVGSRSGSRSYTLHWNGTMWSLVPSPNLNAHHNDLSAVAAIAPHNIWTVGSLGTTAGLILHWDGSAWQVVQSASGGVYFSMAVDSSRDLWMLGYSGANATDAPFVTHSSGGRAYRFALPAFTTRTIVNGAAFIDGTLFVVGGSNAVDTPILFARMCPVNVEDAGFSPSSSTIAQGESVAWRFPQTNTANHSVTDASGMAHFDSRMVAPGGSTAFRFDAAGTYAVRDTATGHTETIAVPLTTLPSSGSHTTTFHIGWSSVLGSSTFDYDVAIKRPGASTYTFIRHGTRWRSMSFVPDAGAGIYRFAAKFRRVSSGRATGWSPVLVLPVS